MAAAVESEDLSLIHIFMDRVLAFFRWLGEAPVNLCICLVGVAIVFAVFDWLLTRKAPITAATA